MTNLKLRYFVPLIFVLVIFFILRWQQLTSLPVFGDEAIYLRWSQLIKNVETLRFVPQSDGKQPLFMWVTAALYKYIADPLIAGRSLSILAGAGTIITLYLFSLIFYNPYIAILTSLIYLLIPFTFFFDRLALPDNLLSMFGMISLLFAFLLAKFPRLDLSLILGFFLGMAWLTKSPAVFFIVLSIVTFALYHKHNLKKIFYPLLSAVVAFGIYNILRLGPQFSQIAIRNKDYIWTLTDIFKHPLDPLIPHLKDVIHIYGQYISLPVIILGTVGIILSKKFIFSRRRPNILIMWWFLPLLFNAIFAKVFTARYILFTLPAFILLLSIGIYYFMIGTSVYFKNRLLQYLIILLCFLPNMYWIYHFSSSPFNTTLPSTELGYVSDWTSGWGIKPASEYLIDRSQHSNVIVGTEGYFGTLPDGLQIYTDSRQHLTIFGVGVDLNEIPSKLIDARNHGDEVYLLLNKSRNHIPPNEIDKLTIVNSYAKPKNDFLQLFRLK